MNAAARYNAATLVRVKGKWYVSCTVPPALREHYNKRKQIRRSTGTSDHAEAKRKLHTIASELYADFDKLQPNPIADSTEKLGRILYGQHYSIPSGLRNDEEFLGEESTEVAKRASGAVCNYPTGNPEDDIWLEKDMIKIEEALGELNAVKVPASKSSGDECFKDAASRIIPELNLKGSTLSNTKLAVREFCEKFPQATVADIRKVDLYAYCDELQARGLANNTITGRINRLSIVFRYFERKGLLEANPAIGMSLKDYGPKTVHYAPFLASELVEIFSQPIPHRERLLLSILICTGMRLDEAALLRWSDYVDDAHIPHFDLTGSHLKIKNAGSRRKVPVIPVLASMLEKGNGAIFDYRRNSNGKTSDASISCMKWVRKKVSDPNKAVHSLRGTLKDLLRDVDTPKEVNDFITGHSSGDVAGRYGSGPSLDTRYNWLCKVEHPWLAK